MINHIYIIIKKIFRYLHINKIYFYLKSSIYYKKVAVPVEKDLNTLKQAPNDFEKKGFKLVSITLNSILNENQSQHLLSYADKNRKKVAIEYLRKGYSGLALIKDRAVVGDIWYDTSSNQENSRPHPDLRWLRVVCGEKDAYAFDMYLDPEQRGNNLANVLQNGVLHEIKEHGFTKTFGYYWADNLPALWVHRTLNWKEGKKVEVTRLLGLVFSSFEK